MPPPGLLYQLRDGAVVVRQHDADCAERRQQPPDLQRKRLARRVRALVGKVDRHK